MRFPPHEYVTKLTELTGAFERVLRGADRSAAVRGCGAWTLAELAAHLGATHRRAAATVLAGDTVHDEHPPAEPLADWYRACAAEVVATFAALDPATPCRVYEALLTVRFWIHRQAVETLIHLHDARIAAGLASTMDPLWAADGVDEALGTLLPEVARWSRPPPLPEPLLLRASDTGDAWLLRAAGPNLLPVVEPGADQQAAGVSTATTTAQELLLLLWNRLSTAEAAPHYTGDPAVAERFLGARLMP